MTDKALSASPPARAPRRRGITIGDNAIRVIFPVFILAMWATTAVLVSRGEWTAQNWALAAGAAVCCLVVFYNFALVFNLGYAAAQVAVSALALALIGVSPAAAVVGGLLIAYGVRLFAFAWRRTRHASYGPRLELLRQAHATLPLPVKVLVWIQTATLYTFEAGVVVLFAREGTGLGAAQAAGALLMAGGLVLESVADMQKQRHKRSGGSWTSTGLYARSRHPNYLGEILLQVGIVVSAIGVAQGLWGWLFVSLAPVYIVILMLSATTGTELAQAQRYGDDPGFDAYVERTGWLFPRVRR